MSSSRPYVASVRGFLDEATGTGQYATVLVDQLEAHLENRTAGIFQIIREIAIMEGTETRFPSETKPATMYTKPLLAGLWHKHYMQGGYIQRNVRQHWTKKRRQQLEAEFRVRTETSADLETLSREFAHQVAIDGLRDRAAANAMTGEWIVYAQQDGKNTYLTLGTHTEDDAAIWQRCQSSAAEFPDLAILQDHRTP